MNKKIFCVALMCAIPFVAPAQSGTNSPYSQYGLGILADQSQGYNRGMNGLYQGLRQGNQVNASNPASYSSVDSLAMIFDVGMTGQVTNFEEKGRRINAYNADFEYVVGSFRAFPKFGVSFGLLPFSNVGYNYSSTEPISAPAPGVQGTTSTEIHSGSGGLHQVFVGFGWEVLKNVSVGANVSYLWGTYEKNVSVISSDAYVNTVIRQYGATVNSYKLDFGLQYCLPLNKDNSITLGATYGLGHNLGADPFIKVMTTNNQTAVSSESKYAVADGLSIPHTFGAGLAWKHKGKLTVGADYSLQKWGDLDFPEVDYNTEENYVMKSGLLSDRHKMTIGGEYLPNPHGKFFERIKYRFGASYATPYIKVNGQDGPKEFSVSAGFGVPFVTGKNNLSHLNISGQWTRMEANGLIKENTFRINIGLTINELWFEKWKVK